MTMRKRTNSRIRRQKGSALLVSLMIMVGLSLLGLGFVAVSETESAIAVNERNYVQAQSAAELGCKTVIEMFQDAPWANDRGILPQNTQQFKTLRTDGANHDYYKPNAGDFLFDVPLKGDRSNKFYGSDYKHADVTINDAQGAKATAYLDKLSKMLFYTPNNPTEKLRITDIRVYAPPWPGAIVNGDGYYDSNASANGRYGVATIRVTAQKIVNGQVRAERAVKAIIAETPFPTVDGAIETAGSLVGQGNFAVYWGKILSAKDMQVNRPAVGMPWFDAKNQMTYEYGSDTTLERKPSTTYHAADAYAPGDLVHATEADITANPNLGKFAYRCVSATAATGAGGAGTVAWPTAIGGTVLDGGVTWKAEASRLFDIMSSSADFYTMYNWLAQLTGRTLEDPWLHARARGTLVYNNNGTVPCNDAVNPHPCDYNAPNQLVASRYSNFFQNLITTDSGPRPERIEAVFPTMDYEFWKAIAQSASNDPGSGIYYFQYAGDGSNNLFTGPGGVTKDIRSWLNAAPNGSGKAYNGLGPGFYFFDTQNGLNPQFNKGGILTPDCALTSGTIPDPKFQMRGYIYLNAAHFGSKGIGNTPLTDVYNMPGEPYRDVGYREVDDTVTPMVWKLSGGALPAGSFTVIGADNGQFDWHDLNGNGQLDIWTEDITRNGTVPFTRPDGTVVSTPTWIPVPWYEGCTVPDPLATPPVVPAPGTGCSEPHEPYANITYPPQGTPAGTSKIEWYDNGISDAQAPTYRRSLLRTGTNTVAPCLAATKNSECTSNSFDKDGALVTLSPILWGVLYNEGGYDGSGNADYYGSLLMRGDFSATGTPNVWFDECLARGCLEQQLKMQRVMVSSMETDNTQ